MVVPFLVMNRMAWRQWRIVRLTESKIRSIGLEKASQWAAIIGVFVGTYFAWKTVVLTKKYGESRDQLNRLDTLAVRQQAELDTLVGVLHELRIETQTAREQAAELKDQGKNIFAQSRDVAVQLTISQQEQRLSNSLKMLAGRG